MSLLRTIESRIAGLVEGTFGKVFRTNVQPVELARRLVKEMDDHQQRTVRRVYVPNVYEVYLSPDDHAQFEGTEAALASELGEYLAEHARRSGFATLSRPRVKLLVDAELDLGAFGIATRMEGEPDAEVGAAGAQLDTAPSQTMIYKPPVPAVAATPGRHYIVSGPDGPFPLRGDRVTVGRGKLNDLVVHETSVSREHAEFRATGNAWSVHDLGSTNGVMVNGARVTEHTLAPGDRVSFGTAQFRFDLAPDDEVAPT
jgi:hypothetical protein